LYVVLLNLLDPPAVGNCLCLGSEPGQGLFLERAMSKDKSKVSKAVMQKVVDRLAQGETLVQIVKDKDMPSYRTITRAAVRDDDMWEMYRQGRVMQAEYYTDHINQLALSPLPEFEDNRLANAEVQRRRLEIDTLKWTLGRNQPWGVRDKKEEAPQQQAITISWAGGDIAVNAHDDDSVVVEAQAVQQVVKH